MPKDIHWDINNNGMTIGSSYNQNNNVDIFFFGTEKSTNNLIKKKIRNALEVEGLYPLYFHNLCINDHNEVAGAVRYTKYDKYSNTYKKAGTWYFFWNGSELRFLPIQTHDCKKVLVTRVKDRAKPEGYRQQGFTFNRKGKQNALSMIQSTAKRLVSKRKRSKAATKIASARKIHPPIKSGRPQADTAAVRRYKATLRLSFQSVIKAMVPLEPSFASSFEKKMNSATSIKELTKLRTKLREAIQMAKAADKPTP